VHNWLHLFAEQVQQTTLVEWLAVAFGVAEVLLARVNNVWLYPTGIAGTLLGIILLLEAGLYAESLLSGYYIVMSIYGWLYWIKKRDRPAVRISWCNRRELMITLLIAFGGWAVLYIVLKNFTPSTVPLMDALVSSTAWAGMWLLARRKIENWVWLNISNLFAIPLLFYKKLPMLAMLTVFLFLIAFWGFFEWYKIYREENTAEALLVNDTL
jgi:nicotinamide mononucleotide transporter